MQQKFYCKSIDYKGGIKIIFSISRLQFISTLSLHPQIKATAATREQFRGIAQAVII